MCGLFFCEIIKGFHHYAIILILSGLLSGLWAEFGELF